MLKLWCENYIIDKLISGLRRLYRNRSNRLNARNDNLVNSKFSLKENETESGRIVHTAGIL